MPLVEFVNGLGVEVFVSQSVRVIYGSEFNHIKTDSGFWRFSRAGLMGSHDYVLDWMPPPDKSNWAGFLDIELIQMVDRIVYEMRVVMARRLLKNIPLVLEGEVVQYIPYVHGENLLEYLEVIQVMRRDCLLHRELQELLWLPSKGERKIKKQIKQLKKREQKCQKNHSGFHTWYSGKLS